jgi:hypothetical protein
MIINNLINLIVIISTFGIFQAGNRAIVLTENKEKINSMLEKRLNKKFFVFLYIS